MTIFRIPEIYRACDVRYYFDCDFATLARRKRDRDRSERDKPDAIIDAQLAWMWGEYQSDRTLRCDPEICVIVPTLRQVV